MLTFRKKEGEMRKFDDATELTYLSKKIENLDETMEMMEEWMEDYNEKQKTILRQLVNYFKYQFSPEQLEKFNEIVKSKETRRWLDAVVAMDDEENSEIEEEPHWARLVCGMPMHHSPVSQSAWGGCYRACWSNKYRRPASQPASHSCRGEKGDKKAPSKPLFSCVVEN